MESCSVLTVSRACFPRLVLHHDLAFPVEGVRHHTGQLSSSLHNQIPEAQVFTAKLLQTVLVSLVRLFVAGLCFVELSAPFLAPAMDG